MNRPMHQRYAYGGTQRRFTSIKPKGRGIDLLPNHPAVVEARTIFPTTVNDVGNPRVKRLLKGGENSRKIGKTITKGRLRGCPIFTLTLEERATCPRSCAVYGACYGNGMPYAQRLKHGAEFEARLWDELEAKQARHPRGFLVRLHVLGDFYSVDYVALWAGALASFPALNVFGYTAREPESDIGAALAELVGYHGQRFAIRFSGHDGPTDGSVVIDDARHDHLPGTIICPAQTDESGERHCGSCGLCWQSQRTIAFARH